MAKTPEQVREQLVMAEWMAEELQAAEEARTSESSAPPSPNPASGNLSERGDPNTRGGSPAQ